MQPMPSLPRSQVAFAARFGTELACIEHLAALRWPGGFQCLCGGTEAWHLPSRPRVFQCTSCERHHSVTAGTVMHRTKVPLVEWFWAAWMLAQDKRGVSALMLARVLDRRYETVWRLLHKLRAALAEDPAAFPLEGVVEVDETYTGGKTSKGKGGRSLSDHRRALVVLVTERKEVPNLRGGIRGSGFVCGDTRMRVVDSAGASPLLGFVKEVCATGTTVVSDGWSAYGKATAAGFVHDRQVEGKPENASALFPLVHTLFANMKTWINGTFHGVGKTWLPAYVQEFTYRLNRRAQVGEGNLWSYVLRRLMRGGWIPWDERNKAVEPRRRAA